MFHVLRAAAVGSTVALGLMIALTAPSTDASGRARGQGGGMGACRTDAATFCQGIEAGKGARMKCLMSNKEKLQPACATAVEARLAKRDEKRTAGRAGDAPNNAQAPINPAQPGVTPPAQSPGGANPTGPNPGADAPGKERPSAARPAGGPGGGRPLAACRSDVQSLCAGVQAGGGARIRCLAENQAKLSPACADALQTKAETGKAQRSEMRGACQGDAQALCAASKGPERRQCLTANVDKLSPACAAALKAPRG